MKKFRLLLLLTLMFSAALMAQTSKKSQYPKPTNFTKKVTTVISGKNRSYYSLSSSESAIINIKGPGKLRVLTRGRFVPKQTNDLNYEILYQVDGGEQLTEKMSSVERANDATYLNGLLGTPAQLRDFEIELGRGNHTIGFLLKENTTPVAVRYIFIPGKEKKHEWMSFSPMIPSEPVDLISKEEQVTYYRFSMEHPMKVEIIGPTELRVLTRIENHYQMKGIIHYRLQVKENDVVINTYQLSSQRSNVAVYSDNSNLVPGKACEFVINVPEGKHVYEIVPLDKDKDTVLGRLLILKKDVKLGK